ncbi:uroporphyrinogen-III C-methyltransferase [Lutibacter sp. HS1-25]|uniref:uroporphyrinogen-III C-methyltransferase n=1 Tax=Lutibacter sp. HS1-25 TaxID=2485000 RepID=UPI001012CC88|nr:uroporphyrinogen-III C-methyltransferase [Lutibacter sp. HS1-25]RXP55487.1 uroporphyrinogen-III C-methyltransferase [Lutibacter sp. HS1-25]
MKLNKNIKVTLIGAGPGDPDLITVKGVKALSKATVVLYDALINQNLLKHAPNATHIFVGKRKGMHSFSQDKINQLIVSSAFQYGNVVRLKGGDPFVFGRGSEEIDYIESFGIETEVISGISSSMAVPASVGIPMTSRGVSESFWVITGTTSSKKLSNDIYLAAQSTATVVVLMGMSKLPEIVAIFNKFNKGNVPTAIIQNGTTASEKIGVGTIDSILEVVAQKKLASPAIIVIGEVVKESSKLRQFYERIAIENL